jgi:hypothetical protein
MDVIPTNVNSQPQFDFTDLALPSTPGEGQERGANPIEKILGR